MKKIFCITIVFSFSFLLLLNSCAKKSSKTTPLQKSDLAAFKTTKEWDKLDGRFKMAYEKAISENEKDKKFECFVKTISKPTEDEKNLLKDAGFIHRSTSENILTGSIKMEDVPSVARLEFVKTMELAVPLSPKR